MKKGYVIFLFLIVTVLVGIRFAWLDRFPPGIMHDEMEYILSAKTFFKWGMDLSGSSLPLTLFRTGTHGIISALPYIILSPIYGLIQLDQFSVRLPYVILNLLTGGILFALSYELFKNRRVATITGLMFLISPWSFYFSRTAVDVPFALFFYVFGIIGLLRYSGKKLLIPFVSFLLGFLSYQGAQPILPPLIIVSLVYKYRLEKSRLNKKYYLLFLAGITIVLGSYFLIGATMRESILSVRSQGLIFFDSETLSSAVNDGRRLSIDNPLNFIFNNKATALINIFVKKYLTAFSTDVLFLYGDTTATYRFAEHGLLYVTDIIFLISGIIGIFLKHRKAFWFLVGLTVIAPISTAISSIETSVINRSFLLLPVFILLIGYGVVRTHAWLTSRIGQHLAGIFIFVVMTIVWINFLMFYFFKYPVVAHENYFMSERIVANYLARHGLDKPTVVITDQPREVFLQTQFYNQAYSGNEIFDKDTFTDFNERSFRIGNVEFTNKCDDLNTSKDSTLIVQNSKQDCLADKPKYSIIENHYGGALYYINLSSMCEKYSTESWKRFFFVSDYSVENLTTPEFCNRWIFLQ